MSQTIFPPNRFKFISVHTRSHVGRQLTHRGVPSVLARGRLGVRLLQADEGVRAAGIDEKRVRCRRLANADLNGVVRQCVHGLEVWCALRLAGTFAVSDILEQRRARLILLDDLGRSGGRDAPREGERHWGIADNDGRGSRDNGCGAENKESGDARHLAKERKGLTTRREEGGRFHGEASHF